MNQILKDNGMTLAAAPKAKSGPLSKEKKNQKLDGDDRYDWSRVEGPDPRDPRCKGSPCFGVHIPQEPGRGSRSGANAHARWVVCSKCSIRILYVPTHGSVGTYRSAGPLAADVATVLEEKPEATPQDLYTKTVGLEGAEKSLMKKLEKIQEQKRLNQIKTEAAAAPKALASKGYVDEDMKKALKRDNALTPEAMEGWEKISQADQSTPSTSP